MINMHSDDYVDSLRNMTGRFIFRTKIQALLQWFWINVICSLKRILEHLSHMIPIQYVLMVSLSRLSLFLVFGHIFSYDRHKVGV